ncbi:hypothetical protein [Yinghuangia seranimata]|uniref:hypothetical protein n=1 Tax=Yinghuangia seranimata TaxID=408067 RepID=UPI00248CD5D6|nr:hypothetical protein [Yinghuangia seranimata]MDI2124610.1 hypothetical protein [Yinghuangia seranimata]
MRTTRLIAATALALSLAVSGCVATPPPQAGRPGPQSAPPMPKTAPGVTDTEIKIGVLYPDAAAISAFVQMGDEDFEGMYRALIDRINARGGVNGRRIVPVFVANNPVGTAPAQEACVRLTEDQKVFAAIGFFVFEQTMCYVETHRTAVIGGPLTEKMYARAHAPWFSTSRGGDEAAAAVEALAAAGLLAGHKVAVVSAAVDQQIRDDVVVPALERAGVHPVATAVMDPASFDTAAVDAQSGIVAQRLRASGADVVIPVGSAVTVLTEAIAATGWRPRMMYLDWQIGAYDANHSDASVFDNAVIAGGSVDWDEATYKECADSVTQALHAKNAQAHPGGDPDAGAPSPSSIQGACADLSLFTAIATKAGRGLDYATFQDAGFALGAFTVPGGNGPTVYGPGKPAGSGGRTQLWTYDPAQGSLVAYGAGKG